MRGSIQSSPMHASMVYSARMADEVSLIFFRCSTQGSSIVPRLHIRPAVNRVPL
jgi:hypothetical protein